MNKDIIFLANHLTERGTEVALYDYAFYCSNLLKMNSYVVYFKNNQLNKDSISKNLKILLMISLEMFLNLGAFTKSLRIHIYIILDGRYFNYPSNVIPLQHSAFRNKLQRNSRFALFQIGSVIFQKRYVLHYLLNKEKYKFVNHILRPLEVKPKKY